MHSAAIQAIRMELLPKLAVINDYLKGHPCRFDLAAGQFKQLFQSEGRSGDDDVYLNFSCFRTAMMLTILRNADDLSVLKRVLCSRTDFATVLRLREVYREHARVVQSFISKRRKRGVNPKLRTFYSLLPQKFGRRQANEIGRSLGRCERTVGSYLKQLKNRSLMDNRKGNYEKVDFPFPIDDPFENW